VQDGTRALLPAHAAGVLSMTVDTDGSKHLANPIW
jgi:hypothetical protein